MPYPINQRAHQFNSIQSVPVSFGLWDTALKFLSPGPRSDVTDHLGQVTDSIAKSQRWRKLLRHRSSCYFEGEKRSFKFKALYCQPSTAFERLAIVTSTPESTQATHTQLTTCTTFTPHSTKDLFTWRWGTPDR